MAGIVVDRSWRPSGPETIEGDLAALWRDVARQKRVARAVMSNLIVFRSREAAGGASGGVTDVALEAVVARHPSRLVVIEHERGSQAICAPPAARVGITVFGPPSAQYAVEQVVVQSACSEASLPSILRPLLRGHVPTAVWWADDLSQVSPLGSVVGLGRVLVYDSRQWRDLRAGIAALTQLEGHIGLADLNWRRLTSFRTALAYAARSVTFEPSKALIRHRPGDRALASLLAGWLMARLRWPVTAWPAIEEARQGDEVLSLSLADHDKPLTAAMNGHRVRIEHPGMRPLVTARGREGDAEAVADELSRRAADTDLLDAIRALNRRTV